MQGVLKRLHVAFTPMLAWPSTGVEAFEPMLLMALLDIWNRNWITSATDDGLPRHIRTKCSRPLLILCCIHL